MRITKFAGNVFVYTSHIKGECLNINAEELHVQYCAKLIRAKFVEIRPLCSRIFKEISNDISRIFLQKFEKLLKKCCVEIENSEKLTKLRRNEVSNERNSKEFSHKQEETSRNFRRNERNMEIS